MHGVVAHFVAKFCHVLAQIDQPIEFSYLLLIRNHCGADRSADAVFAVVQKAHIAATELEQKDIVFPESVFMPVMNIAVEELVIGDAALETHRCDEPCAGKAAQVSSLHGMFRRADFIAVGPVVLPIGRFSLVGKEKDLTAYR